ncbi:unnamed protein product [Ambrosiozyma monospora]|uniref:Unnamed protein product n=1 Tax=Ambrosiozyma monospora TaxID=43982 RepID=A0ACB5TAU0_AMBMO|nr:unnamed protein product [Ambrosiozyma monospora]
MSETTILSVLQKAGTNQLEPFYEIAKGLPLSLQHVLFAHTINSVLNADNYSGFLAWLNKIEGYSLVIDTTHVENSLSFLLFYGESLIMEINWENENGTATNSVEQFISDHLDLLSTVSIKRLVIDTNTDVGKLLVHGDFLRLYKRSKQVKVIASKTESFVLGNLQEAKKSSDVAKTITTFEVFNAESLSVLLEDFNNYTNLQKIIIDQEFEKKNY